MKDLDDLFESIGIENETIDGTHKRLESDAKASSMNLNAVKEKRVDSQRLVYDINKYDREQAVYEGIIPKSHMDAVFDTDKIKENLRIQYKKSGNIYKVYKFKDYVGICEEILSTIRMKNLPPRSYLIGAPNGYGKSSFVTECIITLRKQGYRVVPYISLWELAQLRVDNEQRIMNPYRKFKEDNGKVLYTEPNKVVGFQKSPEVVTGKYSYSEYINADCLFCYFTDVISKDIESHTLYQLLSIRGAKGLPTIVMMSTSLEPYENDKNLKEFVWDEIKALNENKNCYDRVYHISCYKHKSIGLDSKDEEVDSNTGIIS